MENNKNIFFRIKEISVLRFSINNDPSIQFEDQTTNFNVNIRTFANNDNKYFGVDVFIFIKNQEQIVMCEMTIRLLFDIKNYDDFVEKSELRGVKFPEHFVQQLISISISTSRGILYSKTEGTKLGNIYLPVLNPSKFVSVPQDKIPQILKK